MRVYATACEYWRGGIPLNKITIPAETAFQHQCTPAVPEGTVADFVLFSLYSECISRMMA